jgi:hypothetical protein
MTRNLELWTLDPDSVDDQPPLIIPCELQHRKQHECDFAGFDDGKDVVTSTPRRWLRAILD